MNASPRRGHPDRTARTSTSNAMAKAVLITGSSSGIGKATAKHFADKGWNVAATMRNPDSETGKEFAAVSNMLVTRLDVTDRASIDAAVLAAISRFGGLDAVINNAGYGLNGPGEFATKEQVLSQFETNVYGPLAVAQAALPHFRSRQAGVIVNVGSLVGRIAVPFMPLYIASKTAIEGLTEALNLELVPLGVRVKVVEPGLVKTDYFSSVVTADSVGDKTYEERMNRSMEIFMREFSALASTADLIAGVLFEAASDGTAKVRYPVGKDADKFLAERKMRSDEEWEMYLIDTFQLDK